MLLGCALLKCSTVLRSVGLQYNEEVSLSPVMVITVSKKLTELFETLIVNFMPLSISIRKKRTDLPVPGHFADFGRTGGQLGCVLLERVAPLAGGGGGLAVLRGRELWWIFHLGTLRPAGLDVEFRVAHAVVQQ